MRELFDGAPTGFESANTVTQLEALRAGVGLGVVHHFIARRFKDLVRVLPERSATRAYWLVSHEDMRSLGASARLPIIWRRRWRGTGGCFWGKRPN
jgi:DNA-binding transcriptional LysR family regulator